MAQEIIRPPLTAVEARVRALSVHVGFLVDKVALGLVSSEFLDFFPCQYHSIVTLHTLYITRGMNNRSISRRISNTSSHPIDMINLVLNVYFCFRRLGEDLIVVCTYFRRKFHCK
jgi:hypothetical protein